MDSLTFSFFEKSTSNLEGYISQLANNHSISDISELFLNKEGFNILTSADSNIYNNVKFTTDSMSKYRDLSNNIISYTDMKQNENKYDLIDSSGNLLYKKNMNFRETIPPVKDAVLEDTIDIMNYNNYLYSISGIAVAFLVIGIIILKK
jgi:hypothetical protein